jgi:RHS repeat-associated protein
MGCLKLLYIQKNYTSFKVVHGNLYDLEKGCAGGYRFGFNGKENDNEVKGTGNQVDYGARIYDPRLRRWMAVDMATKSAPSWTPYRFGFDNPVRFKDPYGNWEEDGHFWTVYAMGIAMGLKKQTAFGLAVQSEWYDHYVHKDFSMTIHPHKSGFSWGKDGGIGTWADPEYQAKWHGLTGGFQKEVLDNATANVLGGDMFQFHTVGDAWSHSYIDENGNRMMWGGGHKIFGVTLEHAFFGGHGAENADNISKRPIEYSGWLTSLKNIINNPKFKFNSDVTNQNPDMAIFNYMQQNGGNKENNIFLLQSFVGIQSGQTSFNDLSQDKYNLLSGYLNTTNTNYSTSSSSTLNCGGAASSGGGFIETKTFSIELAK